MAILLAAALIRIVLLHMRWINPDEGAHLMDAQLLMQGQVPVVDYGSRQPVYVFLIAVFLKCFGSTFGVARWLPLVSSLGVIVLLYMMGKRWMGIRFGLAAAFIYAILPLILIWSTVVKTEQPAILFATASMFTLLLGLERKPGFLVLSGVLAALAFYIRQPTLYVPIAVILFLLISQRGNIKAVLFYSAGYLGVVGVVWGIYLFHMSLNEILFSQLNPLYLVWNRLAHLFGLLPEKYKIVDDSGFRVLDQSMSYTLDAWFQAIGFSFFIIVGALIGHSFSKNHQTGQRSIVPLLWWWIGIAVLLYFYQTTSRGFYSQYITELLPPLLLLASAPILHVVQKINGRFWLVVGKILILFFGFYMVLRLFWHLLLEWHFLFLLSFILGVIVYYLVFREQKLSLDEFVMPSLLCAFTGFSLLGLKAIFFHDLFVFILIVHVVIGLIYGMAIMFKTKINAGLLFLTFAFFYTAMISGRYIGPQYETVWSSQTVNEVGRFLQEQGEPTDQVLSGGMIWTFAAQMQPFLNTPHPTEFYKYQLSNFEKRFQQSPPRFIILDGYTRRKFSRYWSFLSERIEEQYAQVKRVAGSRYPVDIYQLIPECDPSTNLTLLMD